MSTDLKDDTDRPADGSRNLPGQESLGGPKDGAPLTDKEAESLREIEGGFQPPSPLTELSEGEGLSEAQNSPVDDYYSQDLGISSGRRPQSKEDKARVGRPIISHQDKKKPKSSEGSSSKAKSEAETFKDILDQENQDFLDSLSKKKSLASSSKVNKYNLTGRAKKRARMIALGLVFSIAAAIPIGVIGAIPHAMQSWIQNKVGAYTEHAVDKMGQRVLYTYMKDRVAVGKCREAYNLAGNVAGIGACRPRLNERDTRLSQLFNDWHAAKMEDSLYKHGINVEYDYSQRDTGKPWKITINRPESEGGNFQASGKFGVPDLDTAEFTGKREASIFLKKEMKTALKEDTKWWQYLKRRNMKAGFMRDLGLPGHIFPSKKVAKKLDDFDVAKSQVKTKFRQYLTQYVVSKGDGRVGALLEILLSGESSKGKPSEISKKNKVLAAAAEKMGIKDVEKLLEKYAGKSLQEIEIQIIKNIIANFSDEFAAKFGQVALDAVPIIGWILLALTIQDALDMATDGTLQHWISSQNAQSMIDVANLMDTVTSEEKRAFVDVQSAGDMRLSLVNGLGSSRIFSGLVGYKSPSGHKAAGYPCKPNISIKDSSSLSGSIEQIFKQGDPTALDQIGMASDQDTCENHRVDYDPINSLSSLFSFVQNGKGPYEGLSTYTEDCFLTVLANGGRSGTKVWHCPSVQDIYHGAQGGLSFILQHIGINKISEFISNLPPIKWMMGNFTGWISNGVAILITGQSLAGPELLQGGLKNESKSGARLFDAWVGGGQATQSAFIKGVGDGGGLGGVPLTPGQASTLNQTIAAERKEELASASFFDRMFDISRSDTLASGLIGAAVTEGGINNLLNPISNISLALRAGSSSAYADSASANCGGVNKKGQAVTEFGVVCYGIPDSYIDNLTEEQMQDLSDPDKCDAQTSAIDAKRKEAEDGTDESKKDPDGTGTSTQIDGCRLLCTVTDSMGTEFRTDDKICGFENLSSSTVDDVSSDQTAGDVNTSADYQQLAKSILNSGRVSFDHEADKKDIETGFGACGNGSGDRVALDIKTLRTIDYILNNTSASLRFGAIISGHRCNNGLHPKGLAFDIGNEEVAGVVMPKVFAARKELSINEMYFNGPSGVGYTMDGGKPVPGLKVPDHDDHIHIGVSPP